MTIFRDAWVLVRADFRGDKLNIVRALLFSIIFMGYMAAMTVMVTEDALSGSDGRLMSDFLLISMIPMLGFTFSRRTMKYLSEDSYTRMLAYMRVACSVCGDPVQKKAGCNVLILSEWRIVLRFNVRH